jgi:hypothetical protein
MHNHKTNAGRAGGDVRFQAFAVAILGAVQNAAAQSVPLPQPRPSPSSTNIAGELDVPSPGTPSACQLRLAPDRAVIQPRAAIAGPGECGGADIVSLRRIVTKDHLLIDVSPPATLRCETAEAIVNWVREDLIGRGTVLGSAVTRIDIFDSFECRGQNGIVGAKLSEHGRANALDIGAIVLKSGLIVRPTDPAVSSDFRVAMRASACARFTTVLGPGADGFHEDHIHVDLAERHSGYRICQWDVRQPSPKIEDPSGSALPAILLPRPRPHIQRAPSDNLLPAKRHPW